MCVTKCNSDVRALTLVINSGYHLPETRRRRRKKDFRIDSELRYGEVHPFYGGLSRRELNPIKLAYKPIPAVL